MGFELPFFIKPHDATIIERDNLNQITIQQ